MPIDLNEVAEITTGAAEIAGQLELLQINIQKIGKRMKMAMSKTDIFGDEISDEEKEKHFAKAKEEYEKCKVICEGKIKDLPKKQREKAGQ